MFKMPVGQFTTDDVKHQLLRFNGPRSANDELPKTISFKTSPRRWTLRKWNVMLVVSFRISFYVKSYFPPCHSSDGLHRSYWLVRPMLRGKEDSWGIPESVGVKRPHFDQFYVSLSSRHYHFVSLRTLIFSVLLLAAPFVLPELGLVKRRWYSRLGKA